MSRPIKFRAWHPGDDLFVPQFVTIFGLVPTPDGMNISFSGEVRREQNHPNITKARQRVTRTNVPLGPIALMQYTGLQDKHGVDIYEGDIVRHSGTPGEPAMQVHWQGNYAAWHASHNALTKAFTDSCKVIGNIYENPELLKAGDA
jgi:hypothetical protein